MVKVSIITPWLNCPELIRPYKRTVAGADEIIIIDNGSNPETAVKLQAVGTHVIRNDHNAKYATANNQGMAVATGDILIFLNNDVEGIHGWLDRVRRDVHEGALYGPSKAERMVAGRRLEYIEGYCIAGLRETWDTIGGWDAEMFTGMYWEDNDVCFRASTMHGFSLIQTGWQVWHYGNYTSSKTDGAYDHSQTNEAAFVARVREAANV
jgi:GT2 family glycosyltransferase